MCIRDRDDVFIHQPAATFPATDAKQFYVSVSRGKENVHIYTDDKEQLLEYATEFGDRQSAMELVNSKHNEYIRQRLIKKDMPKEQTKTKQLHRNSNRYDYEP